MKVCGRVSDLSRQFGVAIQIKYKRLENSIVSLRRRQLVSI
nr:MAG TPA: hypothetical protein [Caudoviricetes sp.]